MAGKEARITWKRAKNIIGSRRHTLYGSKGISILDIDQGFIGNCWYLSAAAALAEEPERIERLFLNNVNEVSPNGIYGVNFYVLGVPHTVIVDDYLPLQSSDYGYTTLFANIGNDDSVWAAIIEKAFAKLTGNYEHIVAGTNLDSIDFLSGAPSDNF